MIEILSITFFSGMMSIFIIILLLMGALLLVGKNPFKGFSLTALVTTKPLAAKLSPYGKSTGWKYGLATQKGGATIGRGWREKQTGKPIGLIPKTIESVKPLYKHFDAKGNKEITSFFGNVINNVKVYNERKTKPAYSSPEKASALLTEFNLSKLSADEYFKVKNFVKTTKKSEVEKLAKDLRLEDLAKAWGAKAFEENKTTDAFAKIVNFSDTFGVNLVNPFLVGVAAQAATKAPAEGKDEKKAATTAINKVIYEYNQNFVNEMKSRALYIINNIKKEKGLEVKFDLSFKQVDEKEIGNILKETENVKKGGESTPEKLENIIRLAGYESITTAKDKQIRFSHLVMAAGSLPYLKHQKTQKRV